MAKVLLSVVALLLGTSASAADGEIGTRGGHVTTIDGHRYEVVVDSEKQEMDVYTDHPGPSLPGKLVVAVKKEERILDRVSVDLMNEPKTNGPAHFQGSLGDGLKNQSFIGIQFVIELDKKKSR